MQYNFSDNNGAFTMITDFQAEISGKAPEIEITGEMPLLVTRSIVIFPGTIIPVHVQRKESLALVRQAEKKSMTIIVAAQTGSQESVPTTTDQVAEYGVFGKVVKIMELPGIPKQNDDLTVLVQAFGRCRIKEVTEGNHWPMALVEEAPEDDSKVQTTEFEAAADVMRKYVADYIRKNDDIPDVVLNVMPGVKADGMAVNFYCVTLPIGSVQDRVKLLAESSLLERAMKFLALLQKNIKLLEIKHDIHERMAVDIADEQRENFLHRQLETIREELGDSEYSPEQKKILEKSKKKKWSKEMGEYFKQEFDKTEILTPHTPDYSTQIQYLQTLVDLPWETYTKDHLSLQRAEKTLNHDHYGMEKVKERILEYMAVLSLKKDMKSPILCLYGPPGVGKTSLGKSIASSLGRKYVRVSFGGVHDESEIRGHRRTYVGAMPGRIISGILKAGSSNPVFILDEIDKIGQNNFHGDPSSALLEVLDPEQNNAFHDNYLDVDYDLSKVLFIATANDLGSIPSPLRDRMEIIEVSGYITEEKVEIAKRHLIPREKENHGLKDEKKLNIPKAAIETIIESYTRESGVRQLDKQICKLMRKLAFKKAAGKDLYNSLTLSGTGMKSTLEDLLGKPPFYRDVYQGNKYAGVVTGLAWTSVGGEILFVETSLSKGKQQKLTLTGNLGDVMKESAVLALEYVKAHAETVNIDPRIFDEWNIHIHVPEGATPKDGPSAGITIATSIASAITQRKVRKNTAMTGEITLRGKVLPVGGIKEKILAAKRAGITDIVMCTENRKDVEEIPQIYLQGLNFHYVENVQDVWRFALTNELVENPVTYTITEEKEKR